MRGLKFGSLLVLFVLAALSQSEKFGNNLLKQIHTTVHGTQSNREGPHLNRPRISVLERARSRRQELLNARNQNSVGSHRSFDFSHRNQLLGGECQAFKTENRILKQQLLAAQTLLKQLEKENVQEPSKVLLNVPDDRSTPDAHLEEFLKKLKERATYEPVLVESSTVSLEPSFSSVLETTSFLTTVTETLTRELLVNFRGRKLPTQILDVEEKVEEVTSVISKIIEITPTPSIKESFGASTVHQQPKRHQLVDVKKEEVPELPRSIDVREKILKAGLDPVTRFDSFEEYLKRIRALGRGVTESIQGTSVSTVFISGSVPGQFSTSLITVSELNETSTLERRKRQILPNPTIKIVHTKVQEEPNGSFDYIQETEILGSFSPVDFKGKKVKDSDACTIATVTVTQYNQCEP